MKKLVDENGKLFRKFNLVDFIVLLLLLIILVAVVWKVVSARVAAVKAMQAEEEDIVQEYENSPHLVYKVVCANIPKEIAEVCKQQMKLPMSERKLMAAGSPVEGYITDCWYEPAEDGMYWLYFTIEALSEENEGIYTVGTQEVRLGKGHIVKTYNIETSGWVYEMEEPADE
ncbi:MAG: DUF4330 family protein [Oscillospiraceae bacterium]|nr:DUF4330 family protein [Oscillospiraceae bacterium]